MAGFRGKKGLSVRLNREFFAHLIKFAITGLGNLFFTLGVYYFFLEILAWHYLIAYSISWFLGVLFTYIINFTWVFKPEEKLRFRARLLRYMCIYLFSFGVNFLLLERLTAATGRDPLYVQVFILPLIVAINFLGSKYWALRRVERGDS